MGDIRELERRSRLERRGPFDNYIRGILAARSPVDRRSESERRSDNADISEWMNTFDNVRQM